MLTSLFTTLAQASTTIRVPTSNRIVSIPHPNIGSPDGLIEQVCNGVTWVFAAAIIVSIIEVLLAAYGYMTSSGDPGKVTTANKRLLYAAVGVAVALMAYLFPGMIATILKVSSLGKVC